MSEVFVTADTHFGHESIRVHCRRPWKTLEEHDEGLIDRWNSNVDPKDTVYILGDFAWRNHRTYVQRLRGKKVLILGNHDKMPKLSLEQFTDVKQIHPIKTAKDRLVFLCHYKLQTWPSSHYMSMHLYGHSHGRLKEYPDMLCCDVGVDIWDYTPVPISVVMAKLESKIEAWRQRKISNPISMEELEANVAALRAENLQWLKRKQELLEFLEKINTKTEQQ